MTTGIVPAWKIVANDNDITDAVSVYFAGLRLTDETGYDSDSFELTLANPDTASPIRVPPRGAELTVSLGYDGSTTLMGMFVCDEVSLSGPPDAIRITGKAAVWSQTPKGKTDFQTQKTRTWKAGTVLGAMVQQMAKEHGMTGLVSASLASVQLPHLNQDAESDINLLIRIARRYDAVAKPANGYLIFAKRGEAKTMSGKQLPTITIDKSDVGTWEYIESTRESAGSAVAYYHANVKAKRVEVKAGDGEPVRRIRYWFKTQAEAQAAVAAVLARANRATTRLSFSCTGLPTIIAESPLVITGFHPDVPTKWLITRVVHTIDKRGAYRCEVEAEAPNDTTALVYDVTDGDEVGDS